MAELLDAPPEVAGAGGRLVEQHLDTPADLWRAVRMPQGQGDLRACPCMLPGANTLFWRDAVMSVGGYNPERRTNGEDSDLCHRLEEAGFLTVYTPRAVARHLRTDTVASVLKTIWGWAYWTRVEAGSYNSPETIIEDMPALVAQAAEMLRDDLARGAAVLTPVTYAYPAVQMMLDLRHGAGHGFWTHGVAHAAQERVARLFAREMEARIPGMGAWLAEHLDQVMTTAGEGEAALPPALEAALRALEGPVAALAGLLPNQSSG
jgi:hypothetical protein